MRKLTMKIDELRVETFDVGGSKQTEEGTVLGQQQTLGCTANVYYPCNQPTNNFLVFDCYVSFDPEAANCTNVCATTPAVCSTVKGCV